MIHPESTLPFEVLGQISPILAWAEEARGSKLPEIWHARTDRMPFDDKERSWLLGELPTYSYDNIEDILEGARNEHRTPRRAAVARLGDRHPHLSPPPDFDLLSAFQQLARHFFTWNGGEFCVQEGKMEQLHELALRFPSGHIVRHGHARAVAQGVTTYQKALALPELVTLLPSNSLGLRNVVRRGLSEGHLHLKGVTSAEELWADNLLRPLAIRALKGHSRAEKRLLTLNLFAGRLVALAIWISYASPEVRLPIRPQALLDTFDQLYFARSPQEEQHFGEELAEGIKAAVYGQEHRLNENERRDLKAREKRASITLSSLLELEVPEEMIFLQRWMAPTGHRIGQWQRRGTRTIPGSLMEDQQQRYQFVHRLHLAAHWRLVQLTPRSQRKSEIQPRRDEEERSREKGHEKELNVFADPRRYFLHEALFRYLVCRTHHWQQATQQGRTTGLRYFREYYGSKQRRLTGISDLQEANIVFERLQEWRGLRVLEGRVAPPERAQELVPWILAYARPESKENRRIEKLGLVVHFKKEDERKEERRHLSQGDPPIPWLRWGKRRRMVRGEGMRLYRLLRQPTPIVPFIVGIDACNLELATPPEVFAPVFRFLREYPITLQGEAQRFAPYVKLEDAIRRLVEEKRLGMTFHVGEDFRHLLSGLRAICEVVDFLAPNPGDRLGHGTALALDPECWLENCGYQAVMPRLEWLDTLVWVHHFLGPGDEIVGQLGVEDKIQELAWRVYSGSITGDYDPLHLSKNSDSKSVAYRGLLDWDWSPLTLWDAWKLRQLDPYSIDLEHLPRGKLRLRHSSGFSEEQRRWRAVQKRVLRQVKEGVGSRNAPLLLAMYWLSSEVRKKGREPIVVDMQPQKPLWLELCRRVEAKMKTVIHERELVVEVNPSANRIIGPMAHYGEHHVFHLTLDENKRLNRHVRVSVNTDNPAVCNTTLAHEYYLLGEILTRDGIPEAEVVEWLEWLRANGNDYNFARRLKTPEQSEDMRRLLEWLRGIRPSVLEAQTRPAKYEAFRAWHRVTWLRRFAFSEERVEADSKGLERLVALEAKVQDLRREADRSSQWGARWRAIETELGVLRAELVRAAEASETAGGRQFASRLGDLLKNPDTASNQR